jgi:glycosyltransferase involved in cell wall biosynthesis
MGPVLRVLHCIYDDVDNPWLGGGGARRVAEVYTRLRPRVNATILAGAFPNARAHETHGMHRRYAGLARTYAISRATFSLAASRALMRRDYDAAVVTFSVYAPIRIPPRAPVGLFVHHLTGPHAEARWGRVAGSLVRWSETYRLARARVVATESDSAAAILRHMVAPGTPIIVAPNGVSGSLLAQPRKEGKELLWIGRFDVEQKGLDVLLDAVAALASKRRDVSLRLVGRGGDERAVRALIDQRGLEKVVVVETGARPPSVAERLGEARIVVFASRFEGVSLAFLEAMAAAAPIVATDVGGLRHVARETARLVPANDAKALASAIGALLDDATARQALGQAARAAAAPYDWDVVALRHLEFLEAIAR